MTAAGLPPPAQVDLPVYRGDPVDASFRLYSTPDRGVTKTYLDLTGYTGRAQVRSSADDDVVLLELVVEVADPQEGDLLGVVMISSGPTGDVPPGFAVWDLELTPPGGSPRTWLAGAVPVTGDVTR